MFQLTNRQRRYFGLTDVCTSWDLIKLMPSRYDPYESFAYFDGNIIRKRIIVGENFYTENDLNEETDNNRSILLPKANKGKRVKLTASTLDKRTPMGMWFSFNSGDIYLGNHEINRMFYKSIHEDIQIKDFEDLSGWIEQWISDTTESDLNELFAFASLTKKHYKISEGDFFKFKLNRRLYGYGRILLDYDKLRKEKMKFWDILMGKPLVIKVYHIITTDQNVSIDVLKNLKALPSQFIMDNAFFMVNMKS